jgi:hypothetical protein
MITATFSNGFTDTYKGTRPVKAAWMVTDKATGEVLSSGHSLDIVKARKTAEGTAALCARRQDGEAYRVHISNGTPTVAYLRYLVTDARDAGIEGVTIHNVKKLVLAHNAAINAARRARCTIEVVAL